MTEALLSIKDLEVKFFTQRGGFRQFGCSGAFELFAADFEFSLGRRGRAACTARWDKEVAGVTVFDFDNLTEIAQVHDLVEKNNFHANAPQILCWSL